MRKREIRQKDLKIKFDKKDLKIYGNIWIITGIITVLIGIPALLYGGKSVKETSVSLDGLIAIAVLLCPFLAIFWIGITWKLLEIAGYLKRLKRYGYVVPDSKKLYENNLENLIQDREICKEQGMQKSRAGIALTVIAGIAALLMICINLMLTRVPHIWGILICAALAGIYARQISGRKFRDDVDIYGNPERKVRRNPDDGLLEISLVFIVILVFFVVVPDAFPGKVNPLFYRQAIRYEKGDIDNYGSYDFLPDSLPEEAEDILIRMTYEHMGISFHTSQSQINEYMEIYQNAEGLIVRYSSNEEEDFMKYAERVGNYYLNVSEAIGNGDSCYLYCFKTGFVFINQDTGYVAMYCGTVAREFSDANLSTVGQELSRG